MKQRIICKGLAVAVIILFLGLAIQPSVATVQPKEETDIKPKDYLFQTIIDIVNNPEVKDLLERYNHKIFTSNYDYKSVFSKLMLKKPRFFVNVLFTKPSITYDYLDKCYNKGIEINNILGEDIVLEMIESVEVTDMEFFDELNNIITKDEELSNRLETLKEMNKELNSDWDYPIICSILVLIIAFMILYDGILSTIGMFFINIGFNIVPRIVFAVLIIPVPIILIPSWGLFVPLCIPGWPDWWDY